ncbi:MAG: YfhL family 4Fe-4S dicluster ferredoxin [Gallionella sp.]|nr:YfhL family 4Fe-4S dicluster ferredoxin [Gallionella sp.]
MALSITDACINCGLCEAECPTGAISMGDEYFVIDHDKCNECVGLYDQPRCVVVGPVDCFLDAEGKEFRLKY